MTTAPHRRSPSARTIADVIVIVLIAGLAAAVALLALDGHGSSSLDAARAQALSAAQADARALTTYDYRRIDADFAAVTAASDASFAAKYHTAIGALRPRILHDHTVSVGRVLAVGLQSASTQRAVALVFVDQTVSSASTKTTTEHNRLLLTLVHTGGAWKIDQVALV